MINKHNIMISIFFVSVIDLSFIIIFSILFMTKKTTITSLNQKNYAATSMDNIERDDKEEISIQSNKVRKDTDKSKIDKTMYSMYQSLLIGSYKTKSGIKYNFLSNGSFSGYFDDKHQQVKDYTYEIESTGGNNVVNIYNKEHSAMVSYYIMLSDDVDIVLYYPEADLKILLEE